MSVLQILNLLSWHSISYFMTKSGSKWINNGQEGEIYLSSQLIHTALYYRRKSLPIKSLSASWMSLNALSVGKDDTQWKGWILHTKELILLSTAILSNTTRLYFLLMKILILIFMFPYMDIIKKEIFILTQNTSALENLWYCIWSWLQNFLVYLHPWQRGCVYLWAQLPLTNSQAWDAYRTHTMGHKTSSWKTFLFSIIL